MERLQVRFSFDDNLMEKMGLNVRAFILPLKRIFQRGA